MQVLNNQFPEGDMNKAKLQESARVDMDEVADRLSSLRLKAMNAPLDTQDLYEEQELLAKYRFLNDQLAIAQAPSTWRQLMDLPLQVRLITITSSIILAMILAGCIITILVLMDYVMGGMARAAYTS